MRFSLILCETLVLIFGTSPVWWRSSISRVTPQSPIPTNTCFLARNTFVPQSLSDVGNSVSEKSGSWSEEEGYFVHDDISRLQWRRVQKQSWVTCLGWLAFPRNFPRGGWVLCQDSPRSHVTDSPYPTKSRLPRCCLWRVSHWGHSLSVRNNYGIWRLPYRGRKLLNTSVSRPSGIFSHYQDLHLVTISLETYNYLQRVSILETTNIQANKFRL